MKATSPWQHQLSQAFRTTEGLAAYLETDLKTPSYPLFLPISLAARIKEAGPDSALWRQFVPSWVEDSKRRQKEGLIDPIGDRVHAKKGQIIHRYTDRALYLPTQQCSVICRYCFRKNAPNSRSDALRDGFTETINYLQQHPEVQELIFSGGEPLLLPDQPLQSILERVLQETKIRKIRFHTRMPMILPPRVDSKFLDLLNWSKRSFDHLSLVLHINHKSEINSEVQSTLAQLQKSVGQLMAQTVLLKGVNDNVATLCELFNFLTKVHIRPYYLHHPDKVLGGMHFYLSLKKGKRLYDELRKTLPAESLPRYVCEIPGGGGKVEVGSIDEL